jgi:hypothetical protein
LRDEWLTIEGSSDIKTPTWCVFSSFPVSLTVLSHGPGNVFARKLVRQAGSDEGDHVILDNFRTRAVFVGGVRIFLTGYSFHYDIHNHRDPRDKHWDPLWAMARSKMGASLPNASGALRDILENDFPTQFQNWKQQAETRVRALPATPSDSDIRPVVKAIAEDLLGIVGTSPKILTVVANVANAIAEQEQIKNDAIRACISNVSRWKVL